MRWWTLIVEVEGCKREQEVATDIVGVAAPPTQSHRERIARCHVEGGGVLDGFAARVADVRGVCDRDSVDRSYVVSAGVDEVAVVQPGLRAHFGRVHPVDLHNLSQ